MSLHNVPEQMKGPLDGAALVGVFSAWMGVLSTGLTILATLAGLIWWGIRIYETKTVQEWLARRRGK
jgi:hypothetical protein